MSRSRWSSASAPGSAFQEPAHEVDRAELVAAAERRQVSNWVNLAILMTLLWIIMHQRGLVVLPVFLVVTLSVSMWWNTRALRGVTYRRRVARRRAFPGETVDVEIQVENAKLLPVPWLRVEDEWPLGAPVTDRLVLAPSVAGERGSLTHVFALRWYERVRRRYTLQAERRGVYSLGPVRLHSGDVFGLFQSQRVVGEQEFFIVYPRIVPLPELGLPSKEPFGDTRARQHLFEDPSRTMGARDMQPGDSFRHVHWPASVRRQQLQARVYEPTTTVTVVVALDVATLAPAWTGVMPDLLERAISVAASLAAYAAERRYAVGFICNGTLLRSDRPVRVMPGRSPDQLTRILEILAAVRGYATLSMDRLLLRESPALPWGATLVVVAPLVSAELLASIERLRTAGRRMVLVSLAKEAPPVMEGVVTHHLGG